MSTDNTQNTDVELGEDGERGMVLVVWTANETGRLSDENLTDYWEAFSDFPRALERYNEVCQQDGTAIASIAGVIGSTDYVPYVKPEDALLEYGGRV
jgi:hypothetical protein